ncbi:MAG: inositol monophosphatase [Desulfobacteraceae bacterium]|nr:MAG: inositol monophosphatase [Desulfobacteraceae bacterium]
MWARERETARRAAREAGRFLKATEGKIIRVDKKGRIDLVSEADLESEKIILEMLKGSFPEDSILTEEAGRKGPLSSRTWMVDPLDGTTNYVHGFPFYAVSIALMENEELLVGAVYDPSSDEMFEAEKEHGAYLNGSPIRVSTISILQESLLATGFPYSIYDNLQPVMNRFEKMIVNAQGVRRPGSAAMDLCYVAAGRLDGFWEEGLKPWDTAAGSLIVKEAGGRIATFDGSPHTPFSPNIVAANPLIFDSMLATLNI